MNFKKNYSGNKRKNKMIEGEERWRTEKMDQGGGHSLTCLRCPGLCELKVSEKPYSSSVKGYPDKAAC